MLKLIYESIVQLFYPSHCPSCKAYTESQGQWCQQCFEELVRMDNLTYDETVRKYVNPVFAMGKYDKGLKHLIHQLKFEGKLSGIRFFKPFFSILEDELDLSLYDFIIPVPLHKDKFKARGFNQVDEIFKQWCQEKGYAYENILIRQRFTASQYALNYEARQANLHKAFVLRKEYEKAIIEARCLLVDDIFTTGSTLKECGEVLLKHGAKSVSGLVLASNAD